MAQVTLYLDAETERKMKAAAEAEGVSYSKWVARLIEDKVRSDWPADIAALCGAWADLPSAEELRQGQGTDVLREAL